MQTSVKFQAFLKPTKTLLWISFGLSILFFLIANQEKNLQNYLMTLALCLMYTFGYGSGNYTLEAILDHKFSWVTETRKKAIWTIGGALVLNTVLTYILNYISYVLVQGVPEKDFFSEKYSLINWFFINLALLISTFLQAREFMMAMKQNTKQQIVKEKLIATSANARFESLKNQLDPHFLFNSLNVLSALIEENPKLAEEFTGGMSKVYRYVLDQKDKELVTVAEELDFAKTYADLLKTRFEESVHFSFEVEPGVMQQFVVPLSLQLLIENAIKHNFATVQKPLEILIYSNNNQLIISNNFQPRDNNREREGIGISNIVQRYSLLSKDNVLIEQTDDYFKVTLPILNEKTEIMSINNFENNDNVAYQRAAKRVRELKGFYGNLISYCMVIPFLIFVNLYASPEYHWFWWPMLGWGIGLASHAIQTFGVGRNWEERKIQEIMNKQKNNNNEHF